MHDPRLGTYFDLFNEIGILAQLSRTMFEARLPQGVLVPHFSVLNHLLRVADGRTPQELARAFQLPKATMSHQVALLEGRGLVETRPNPADGRSKCVCWITAAGRTFRDEAVAALAPDIEDLAKHFDLDDVQRLLPRLAEIRGYLDAARDPDPRAAGGPQITKAPPEAKP